MSKWVEFTAAHDHRPVFNEVTSFKLGDVFYLPDDIADAAIEAGKAVATTEPEPATLGADEQTAHDRGSDGLAVPNGDDAHRDGIRVQLNDAAPGE